MPSLDILYQTIHNVNRMTSRFAIGVNVELLGKLRQRPIALDCGNSQPPSSK